MFTGVVIAKFCETDRIGDTCSIFHFARRRRISEEKEGHARVGLASSQKMEQYVQLAIYNYICSTPARPTVMH